MSVNVRHWYSKDECFAKPLNRKTIYKYKSNMGEIKLKLSFKNKTMEKKHEDILKIVGK